MSNMDWITIQWKVLLLQSGIQYATKIEHMESVTVVDWGIPSNLPLVDVVEQLGDCIGEAGKICCKKRMCPLEFTGVATS